MTTIKIDDSKEMFKYYLDLANKNDVNAQYYIGQAYLGALYSPHKISGGIEPDDTKAYKWFYKAALNNHEKAQLQLGFCYGLGVGVAEDDKMSAYWFNRAAEHGNTVAMYYLANKCLKEKEYDKAINYYLKSGDQGLINIAEIYEELNNHLEAFKWYKKSVNSKEFNCVNSYFKLASYYYDGMVIDKDINEAIKWYEKAAELGHTESAYKLGVLFEKGKEVNKNLRKAIKYYIIAADLDDYLSIVHLEFLYKMGEDLNDYYDEKFELLFKARSRDVATQIEFGYKYLENKLGGQRFKKEALDWYLKLSKQNNFDAMYLLYAIYWRSFDQNNDYSNLLKIAANNNHKKAQYLLALKYKDEENTDAIKYFIKAAEELIDAQIELGYFYGNGIMVEVDYKKAYEYYLKAINQYNNLGVFKQKQIDYTKKRYLSGNDRAYEKALTGDVYAYLYLAIMYEYGFEVQVNKDKALKYYQASANLGNKDAKNKVKELSNE